MNISKFTQKSMQAVERCEKLAYEYGNQEIEQEHLLYSLATIEDSLILKLIEKMEIHTQHFLNRTKAAVEKRVKVQGGQVYMGKDLNKVLISAEDEARQWEMNMFRLSIYFYPCCGIQTERSRSFFKNTASQGNGFCRRFPL